MSAFCQESDGSVKTPTSNQYDVSYNNLGDDFDDDDFESYESTTKDNKIYDPYEKVNRKIFVFNDAFDRYFLEHVARLYRKGLPKFARTSIRNFLNNLSLPVSAANSLMQGKGNNFLATISNFIINSTIGVGGIFNIAGEKGIFYEEEDFGQTLAVYGVGPGPYLMLPFFGPSTVRDGTGWLTDTSIDPLGFNVLQFGGREGWIPSDYRIGFTLASGIDTREGLIELIDDIRKDSFDPYATVRSAYLQRRIAKIEK